ncbi:PREDICTED: putative FBD-associated F-box protein At5g56410 [Camelina sativa]|uniref:FBD-associated F-box protein At5g56410 n=1 Tax=Camelina sativa TaxID=90675 RepID=A0ABM0WZD6_CAMSA|nr:PREDICTED: putative FBD-associated F-box protein At5g56410 [Camelina sativa]
MDKIIGFSDDELLVKILSFLPTKDAASTSILSKHWKFLWMRVPKIDFNEMSMYSLVSFCQYIILEEDKRRDYLSKSGKSHMMRRFIDRNLPLHSSPVIESLRLELFTEAFQPEDIKQWVEIAISRCIEELSVAFSSFNGIINAVMPSSLYTCKSLVTLKLKKHILVDVPHAFCLPSLKTLHLRRVIYADEESLQRLLSNSSVLEDLVLELCPGDNVRKFAIIIPSLLSLSFDISAQCTSDGYIIDTPSLKYFKALDRSDSTSTSTCFIVKNMPKLEEAQVCVGHNVKKLLQAVTSVKRLSLLVEDNNSAEAVYGDDFVFNKLEHLYFHIYGTFWSKLLFQLLNASPKLRDFTFNDDLLTYDGIMGASVCWKQLKLSSLQTFKWLGCHRSVEGKDLATYIFRNSCLLKTATISLPETNLELETEVNFWFRGSPTCNLVFTEDSDYGERNLWWQSI